MYLSIDIETTGLDPTENQILMVSAIWDDLITPLEDLKHITFFVDNGDQLTGNPYALSLNKWILDEISAGRKAKPTKYPVYNWIKSRYELKNFIQECAGNGRIYVAGKNAAGFDIPFLKTFFGDVIVDKFKHRVLDPGSMFAFLDGTPVPDLAAIKKHIGAGDTVSHDAYEDALDVCRAIRFFVKNKK